MGGVLHNKASRYSHQNRCVFSINNGLQHILHRSQHFSCTIDLLCTSFYVQYSLGAPL
ncbi:hypothetical protein CCC_03595 [Paramagnetospirillum magnetotacticum MS-1]|uniref:Uncharacterized protein n=1 Tax=Paramagnetospirillum magnetotacticum MS-1 TaxID=272627 RepID=A0A0C2U9Z9_PARME|nr:hypothetical protein CCC_03595 [Paramagnetospirillum magnetotacticum MS-1]